jgi:hypothetical protein
MWIFSKAAGGFFRADKKADYEAAGTWPADGIEVSDEVRDALIGKPVTTDENGNPVVAIEAVEQIRERAIAEIRRQRAPMLDALSGIASRAARAGDSATATAADQAADNLLNITTLPSLLAATTYDDMKEAVLARYREISDAAPPSVQNAFREVFAS